MIKLKHFKQSPGLCGPASLKMVLDYYGFSVSEKKLAELAGASREKGTSAEGLKRAAEHFGLKVLIKKNSSINDIKYFIKKRIPVIVDWFLVDDGHYSVVVDINEKYITLMDPTLRKFLIYVKKRKLKINDFLRVWFDFPDEYIKTSNDLILRLIVVVFPPSKREKNFKLY